MPTRSEILDTLAASQEQVTAYFQGVLAIWDIRSENRGKIVGEDQHCVKISERAAFNFICLILRASQMGREDTASLNSTDYILVLSSSIF